MLFSTLQRVLEGHLHYKLFGEEYAATIGKKGHNVDCLLTTKYETSALEFDGCWHHSCGLDPENSRQCHLPLHLQEKDHATKCHICIAAKQPASKFRPRLWRLKAHESPESKHPSIQKPYFEIAQETSQIQNDMKRSNEFDRVISIKECEIIYYWSKPISHFLRDFDFKAKPNTELHTTLGGLFESTLVREYPVFDPAHKVTTQRLINLIKSRQIFGLLVISGFAGKNTQSLLQDFPPFSHLKQKRMENSFQMEKQLVTTEFCAYLLNHHEPEALPDFVLTRIHQVFLYPNYSEIPFEQACKQITKLILTNKNDTEYVSILKAIPNFFIGNMAANPNSAPRCILLTAMDMFGLPQTPNFVKCEHLTGENYMAHFKNNRLFKNTGHNNLAIIQKGRIAMIQLVVTMAKFLQCSVKRSNTDGLTLVSQCPFPITTHPKPHPIFLLDLWLKPNLTEAELVNYITFKKQYFEHPFVCPTHEDDYLSSLSTKTDFHPDQCCIQHKYFDEHLKIKVEQLGVAAIIKGINQMVGWDFYDSTPRIKCSGLKQRTLADFLNFTKHDLGLLHCEMIVPS